MTERTRLRFASAAWREGAVFHALVAATVGILFVGQPTGHCASDSTATEATSSASNGALVEELTAVRGMSRDLRFDEAQSALTALAGQYANDPLAAAQIDREARWLGVKRRMTRAESLAKQGRNIEAEAVYRGTLAEVASGAESGTGVSPVRGDFGFQPALQGPDASATADVAHLARSKARKDLMLLYLNWGRTGEIDSLWAEFAADRGANQAPYALKLGEEFREAGECARSMAAYDLAAEGYSTATEETDLDALREARVGAAAAGCLVAGSGKSVADIAAVAAQTSTTADRAEDYQRAIKFLLQMKAPEEILALSGCAPDAAGRAVCRVRGLMATNDFDRAASESLQALCAQPGDKSVAGVAAFVLQKMSASNPGDLERGRGFFEQASALAQGDAAIRIRGGWALFLARAPGETTSTLAVLDDMPERFADRRTAAVKEIDRVAGEWDKQHAYSLEAEAHERLAGLTQGAISLGHLRNTVKTRVMANSTSGTLARAFSSILAFNGPGKEEAVREACNELIGAGRADEVRKFYESVLADLATPDQAGSARVALARLDQARAVANSGDESLAAADIPVTQTLLAARDAMSRGDYEAALDLWRRALADASNNAENAQARLGLIEAGLSRGDTADALNAAVGLSSVDPDPIYGLWTAVLSAVSRGHAATATVFADNLASLDLVNAQLLAETCRAIDALGKGEATDTSALRAALLALPGEGHETAAMMALADALRMARQYAAAREIYERVTALTLGGGPSYRPRAALALMEAEEGTITSASLDAVSASVSDGIGTVAICLAEEYVRREPGESGPTPEQWRRKLAAYETIIRRAPDSDRLMPRALLSSAESLCQLGDHDAALERFTLLIHRYPHERTFAPIAGIGIVGLWNKKSNECERARDWEGQRTACREGLRAYEELIHVFPDNNVRVQYQYDLWAAYCRSVLRGFEAKEKFEANRRARGGAR